MNPRIRYNRDENSFDPIRINRIKQNSSNPSNAPDSTNSVVSDVPVVDNTTAQSQLRRAVLSESERATQADRVNALAAQIAQSQAQPSGLSEMLGQIRQAPQAESPAYIPQIPPGQSTPPEMDVDTFLQTQAASMARRNALATPLESSLLGQLQSNGFPNQPFVPTPDRPAAPFIIGQGTLFNTPGEDVRPPMTSQQYIVPDYPEVGYEQEDAVRRARQFSDQQHEDLLREGRARVSEAKGVAGSKWRYLNQMEENQANARTAEQISTGAPIVPYDPSIDALKIGGNPFTQFVDGVRKGFANQHIVGDYNDWPVNGGKTNASPYSRSYIADRMTGNNSPYLYQNRPIAEIAGVELGRMAGDFTGNGSRKHFWTIQPEDITNTYGSRALETYLNINPALRRTAAWGASNAMGILGGNYNPLNIEGGGRAAGYQAVNPTETDLTKSENPVVDMLLYRGMMGRTGRLLPWEEFHAERPNVSYEDYDKYKAYLREPGTLGLIKGTMDGIDGPESRILGYRVSPLGVLGAAGVLGGTALAVAASSGLKRRVN